MTVPKKRGRPRKVTPKPEVPDVSDIMEIDDLIGGPSDDSVRPDGSVTTNMEDVYGGVSANWLAQVFGHDKNTIKKKLSSVGCPVVGRRGQTPLYSIPEAASYLVKPKVDIGEYIKSMRPNDLPPILNAAYWDAMLKRQKWEENARDLWRTEDVLAVLGDVAFNFKSTVNLWVEEVDRTAGLTAEQRATLTRLSDSLLERVHEQMIEAPAKTRTVSSVNEEGAVPPEAVMGDQE